MASLSQIASTPDLTEQVYQRLLYAICDGELAPGARLTQEELAAALGVSRQPILQALRLLKKDGFVSDAGRRGAGQRRTGPHDYSRGASGCCRAAHRVNDRC